MANLIIVRSTIPTRADGGNVVVLYETHEDHPDGEAYVAGPTPVRVARTGLVHRLISDGALEEVEAEPEPVVASRTVQTPPPATQDADVIPGVTVAQRDALVAAGFETTDDIRAATDDDLLAVDGIGHATVERLREATKE